MLECLKFILKFVADFCAMLFTIDLGNGLSFGLLMCICFIVFPMVHRVVCFIKQDAIDELNAQYESSRPTESWSATREQHASLPNNTTLVTHHSLYKSRRYKL